MHVWFIGPRGHSGQFAGRNRVRPLFRLPWFFCLVEIIGFDFGVKSYGIFGLGGLGTLEPSHSIRLVLRFSMLEVG